MSTVELNAAVSPTMDQHPIQGEVEILLIASCYGNRDKLRPDEPIGLYADFTVCGAADVRKGIQQKARGGGCDKFSRIRTKFIQASVGELVNRTGFATGSCTYFAWETKLTYMQNSPK